MEEHVRMTICCPEVHRFVDESHESAVSAWPATVPVHPDPGPVDLEFSYGQAPPASNVGDVKLLMKQIVADFGPISQNASFLSPF